MVRSLEGVNVMIFLGGKLDQFLAKMAIFWKINGMIISCEKIVAI
jgi:hypothetical protein